MTGGLDCAACYRHPRGTLHEPKAVSAVVVATVLAFWTLIELGPMVSRLESQLNPMEMRLTLDDGARVVGKFSVDFDGTNQLLQADGTMVRFTSFRSLQSTQPIRVNAGGEMELDETTLMRRAWPTWALHTLLLLMYVAWLLRPQ